MQCKGFLAKWCLVGCFESAGAAMAWNNGEHGKCTRSTSQVVLYITRCLSLSLIKFLLFFSFDGHNFATSRYPSSYLVGYGSMSTGCFRFVFGYGHIIWVMFSIRFSAFDFYYYYYYYGYPGNLYTSWLILRVLNLMII